MPRVRPLPRRPLRRRAELIKTKRRAPRLKARDFQHARRQALRALDRGDLQEARQWAWEAREFIRRGPVYLERRQRGKRSKARGSRAQNKTVAYFASIAGWTNVRDRGKQEAANIRLGADCDVFGNFPLVVQIKHGEESVRAAWNQLMRAPKRSDQALLVRLQSVGGKPGRPHVDVAAMALHDLKHLFNLAEWPSSDVWYHALARAFNLRDAMKEAVEDAAQEGMGTVVLLPEWDEQPHQVAIFEWKVFQKIWEIVEAA